MSFTSSLFKAHTLPHRHFEAKKEQPLHTVVKGENLTKMWVDQPNRGAQPASDGINPGANRGVCVLTAQPRHLTSRSGQHHVISRSNLSGALVAIIKVVQCGASTHEHRGGNVCPSIYVVKKSRYHENPTQEMHTFQRQPHVTISTRYNRLSCARHLTPAHASQNRTLVRTARRTVAFRSCLVLNIAPITLHANHLLIAMPAGHRIVSCSCGCRVPNVCRRPMIKGFISKNRPSS